MGDNWHCVPLAWEFPTSLTASCLHARTHLGFHWGTSRCRTRGTPSTPCYGPISTLCFTRRDSLGPVTPVWNPSGLSFLQRCTPRSPEVGLCKWGALAVPAWYPEILQVASLCVESQAGALMGIPRMHRIGPLKLLLRVAEKYGQFWAARGLPPQSK